ncbi:MAG: hypothetical protein IJ167_01350, partial [Lachnospiraceae bacterium]|nr:hypothetical protein [Lachnospiraceae bacterium]
KIYCIDVNDELKKYIPKEIYDDCVFVSHTFNLDELDVTPEEMCKRRFKEYCEKARLIITTRLHGAVPCAAFGIPVVFAKDEFSWRFSGIDKILKIYAKEDYDKIDWNPKPCRFEELKKLMLENAKERVEGKTDYEKIRKIHDVFFDSNRSGYIIEFLNNTFRFIDEKFKNNNYTEYALWGVNQTANAVYEYIKEHYNNAKLKVVVDSFKSIDFLGLRTTTASELINHKDIYVFVCAAAAIRDSEKFFAKYGITNYYQCCLDDLDYLEKK